uniref:5-azacytidine induced 2 n=1 Tax=Nothobranchius furzeri TaxID=105023 RepID=A0A8C6KSE7_NOTFU
MDPLAVDDDICILKHETAYTAAGESPVSVCAGDESVASHFALVTAYEDIKKRLRDTERDNTLLRKRVKQLEDKLFRPEAPPSEGPHYVNKAFSAYRGIYIEKEDLQMELNKLKKEKSESERMLTEQLQAKELELLQLRTELETTQGTAITHRVRFLDVSVRFKQNVLFVCRDQNIQQIYKALCCEVTRLHSELKHQTDLITKLRPLIGETRPAASTVPVQCLDDVEKNNNLPVVRAPVPRPPTSCLVEALASLDDSSRSFPSPPKPSDAMFWEGHAAASSSSSSLGNFTPMSPPNTEWTKPY